VGSPVRRQARTGRTAVHNDLVDVAGSRRVTNEPDRTMPPPAGPGPAGGGSPADGAPVAWGTPPPSGNGCLRACLIVGGLLLALFVVGVILLVIVGGRLVDQVQNDPDSVFGAPCPIASAIAVSDAVGETVDVNETGGFFGGTMGVILDKRLLPDAPECYAIGDHGFAARIAVDGAGGSAAFASARAEADGAFLYRDVDGLGDEAFCTEPSAAGSVGALVRWADTVAYVSVMNDRVADLEAACQLAGRIAGTLEP
jgi:hypothetical protein